jgi:hypothetical protein
MYTEAINKETANHKAVGLHHLLALFIALVFTLTIYPPKAHAQIVGNLEVNVPFAFQAGNSKLPAGEYRIHMLENSDLTVMQISTVDGTNSVLVQVRDAEANSRPTKSELTFNKYGNSYFLAKVFDEGNPSGSEVVQTSDEKRISQGALEAQEHVPASH